MFPLHDDNPTYRTPVVTYGIIVVNALAFLWLLGVQRAELPQVYVEHGFVPARIGQLATGKPIEVPVERLDIHPITRQPVRVRQPIRLPPDRKAILLSLVTCMFMHGGWLHLIGNMWFLWLFGNNVEDRLGSVPFLVFYFVGGLAATACHWAVEPHSTVPVIGASGAVAAVLGAYAITWPWARVTTLVFLFFFITIIRLPALVVLGFWFAGQLLEGFHALNLGLSGGVAWWAHVGGFLAGLAAMPALRELIPDNAPRRQIRRVLRDVLGEDGDRE